MNNTEVLSLLLAIIQSILGTFLFVSLDILFLTILWGSLTIILVLVVGHLIIKDTFKIIK